MMPRKGPDGISFFMTLYIPGSRHLEPIGERKLTNNDAHLKQLMNVKYKLRETVLSLHMVNKMISFFPVIDNFLVEQCSNVTYLINWFVRKRLKREVIIRIIPSVASRVIDGLNPFKDSNTIIIAANDHRCQWSHRRARRPHYNAAGRAFLGLISKKTKIGTTGGQNRIRKNTVRTHRK